MSDAVLAELPSSGMTPMNPKDCEILLKICTVMCWTPKLPLLIMRDESAGRWFMKGKPGAQDYWLRDGDLKTLMMTPMWDAVMKAEPFGLDEPKTTAIEIERRAEEGFARIKKVSEKISEKFGVDKDDALDMYVELAKRARESDLGDDPVEHEKAELAKRRLAAEEQLKKLDEWDE